MSARTLPPALLPLTPTHPPPPTRTSHRPGWCGRLTLTFTLTLSRVVQQIEKDVPRTMTEHVYFRGAPDADSLPAGQAALSRLLRAYAAFNPLLGHTQGRTQCTPTPCTFH